MIPGGVVGALLLHIHVWVVKLHISVAAVGEHTVGLLQHK